MRFEVIFVSLVALLLSLILLAFGGILLVMPQAHLFDLFLKKPHFLGALLILIGVFLLLSFYGLSKKRYLRCKMGGYSISENVLTELTKKALEEFFPHALINCSVVVRRDRKLEIAAHLPSVEMEAREELLKQIEAKLTKIFFEQCGLKDSYHFIVA